MGQPEINFGDAKGYLLFLVIVNVILSVTKIFMKKFDTNNAMSPSASADQREAFTSMHSRIMSILSFMIASLFLAVYVMQTEHAADEASRLEACKNPAFTHFYFIGAIAFSIITLLWGNALKTKAVEKNGIKESFVQFFVLLMAVNALVFYLAVDYSKIDYDNSSIQTACAVTSFGAGGELDVSQALDLFLAHGIIFTVSGLGFIAKPALMTNMHFTADLTGERKTATEFHLGAGVGSLMIGAGLTEIAFYVEGYLTPGGLAVNAIAHLLTFLVFVTGRSGMKSEFYKVGPLNMWTIMNFVFMVLFWLTVDFDYLKSKITETSASVLDHTTTLDLLLVFGLLHVIQFIQFRYFNEKAMGLYFQTESMDAKFSSFISWFTGFIAGRFMAVIGFVCIGVYWAGYGIDGNILDTNPHFSKFTLFFAIANTAAFVLLLVKRKSLINDVSMNNEMVNLQILMYGGWALISWFMGNYLDEHAPATTDAEAMSPNTFVPGYDTKWFVLALGAYFSLNGLACLVSPSMISTQWFSSERSSSEMAVVQSLISNMSIFLGLLLIGLSYYGVFAPRMMFFLTIGAFCVLELAIVCKTAGLSVANGIKPGMVDFDLFQQLILTIVFALGTDFDSINADTGAILSVILVGYILAKSANDVAAPPSSPAPADDVADEEHMDRTESYLAANSNAETTM